MAYAYRTRQNKVGKFETKLGLLQKETMIMLKLELNHTYCC